MQQMKAIRKFLKSEVGVVVYACNPSIREAEVGGLNLSTTWATKGELRKYF
jgi:hypothetical protein